MIRRCESRAYLQHTAQSNGVLSLVLPEQEAKTLQLISNVEFTQCVPSSAAAVDTTGLSSHRSACSQARAREIDTNAHDRIDIHPVGIQHRAAQRRFVCARYPGPSGNASASGERDVHVGLLHEPPVMLVEYLGLRRLDVDGVHATQRGKDRVRSRCHW